MFWASPVLAGGATLSAMIWTATSPSTSQRSVWQRQEPADGLPSVPSPNKAAVAGIMRLSNLNVPARGQLF
jgi:hypothetical protein